MAGDDKIIAINTTNLLKTNNIKDVDTTKTITHVGLCAGYGGIELGLGRVIKTLRSVALCEIEAFPIANLVSKMEAGLMDAAPIWTDLKTFPWEDFRDRVDILTGGYPCQPFSAAGKRLGKEDPRHLWPWIADGIRTMRPRVCFFENVEGHISLGLREVISELEGLGYKTAWGIFSAREVGAPHQRKRVFILAHRIGDGYDWRELQDHLEGWTSGELPQSHAGESCGLRSEAIRCGQAWPSRPGQPQHEWEPPRVVGDSSSQRCEQAERAVRSEQQASGTSEECGAGITETMGNAKHDGSHQCDSESRGENASSEQGWMQESEGGSASVGDTEHDGSLGLPECRGSHQDCNRSEERSLNAIESEGAGRSADCGHLPENQGGFVGNSEGWSNGQQQTEQQGRDTSWGSGEESGTMGYSENNDRRCGQLCQNQATIGAFWDDQSAWTGESMGDTKGEQGSPRDHREQSGTPSESQQEQSGGGDCGLLRDSDRKAQPSLGGDSDGSANRMDDAELFVTSDNRTDELRLLGNGVVPATAERAFIVLTNQLLNQ